MFLFSYSFIHVIQRCRVCMLCWVPLFIIVSFPVGGLNLMVVPTTCCCWRVQVEPNHNHLIGSLNIITKLKVSPPKYLPWRYLPKKWTKKWPWINPSLQLHKTLLIAQFTLVFCLEYSWKILTQGLSKAVISTPMHAKFQSTFHSVYTCLNLSFQNLLQYLVFGQLKNF